MMIGLAGYAGVGKTSLAAALSEAMPEYGLGSFAGALKRRVDPLFPLDADKALKRETYVAYGRAMRSIDPDYWIKALDATLPGGAPVIIDDVRYANEVRWIKECRGIVFRIQREGIGPVNQEEAESFAAFPILPTIHNDKTLEAARDAILSHMGVI
jgi:hypothetical protein